MKVKLVRSDLYNNDAYVLNDTYIEYSSDKPKTLNVTFTCLLSIATSQLCKPRTKSKIKNYKQRCLLSPFMFLGRVLSHLAGLLFHPFLGATRWMLWTDFGTERWKYRHQWKNKSKAMALFWNKHQCKRTECVWLLECYYKGQQKWYFLCTVLLSCDETPNGMRNNPSCTEWLPELPYLELTWTFHMGKGHYFSRPGNNSEIQFSIRALSRHSGIVSEV